MKIHPLRRFHALSRIGFAFLVGLSCAAFAQEKSRHYDLYMYKGPDREQRLLEGARKEGTVVIYTSLNLKDSVPITEAFEKKYGIKTSLWRAGSEKVLNRSVTEARAGRFSPDVIETNGPEMEAMYRENLLSEFYSPAFKDIPSVAFPAHRHYVATRFNFFVLGYNTNLVKPEDVPNTFQDLLHPRWAGKIGIEASDSDWFAAVVKSMGEKEGLAYFRKLAESRPQMRTGHTLMAELLSAGELPIAATVYNQNVERLVQKGAPVKWKPLAPTFGRPNAISVAKKAPHPHAALLFADFMLSREGQELIKQRNRVPSSNAVDSPLNKFPYRMIDPVIVLDESAKWEKLWANLFHNGVAPKKETE
ncbi:MAG TPA: extracellular solute-binding protein [Burkholderiaceae bacterium]|jgi:iron(III) transport system substrate-binding protein|nr:extracellular solute-binding protein [Burkholderiaceae bacterium]